LAADTFVVIGDTTVARRVCSSLAQRGHEVRHVPGPDDDELRESLDGTSVRGIAILLQDDVDALRYALAAAHIHPSAPMMVTIFDRTIGDQLARFLPQCDVTSPADLAAPSLAGPCIQPGLLAVTRAGDLPRGIRTAGAVLDEVPVTVRARRRASATVRPPASARCASRRDPLTGSRSRCREGRRLATPVPDLSLDAPNATQPACSRDLEMPTTPRPSGQSVECQIHCKNCQLS
jgi:hypothetical protein